MIRIGSLLVVLMCSLLVAAGNKSRATVTIKNLQFVPASIVISAGDTVTWVNNDDRDHKIVAADGSFTSGNIPNGKTFSHQFKQAGQFAYGCGYHPRMKGIVIVK